MRDSQNQAARKIGAPVSGGKQDQARRADNVAALPWRQDEQGKRQGMTTRSHHPGIRLPNRRPFNFFPRWFEARMESRLVLITDWYIELHGISHFGEDSLEHRIRRRRVRQWNARCRGVRVCGAFLQARAIIPIKVCFAGADLAIFQLEAALRNKNLFFVIRWLFTDGFSSPSSDFSQPVFREWLVANGDALAVLFDV